MNLLRWRFLPLLLAAAMAACDSPATVQAGGTLAITPADPVVTFGDSAKVTAVHRDAAGTVLPFRPVTWSSSAPEIVSVNGAGVLRAHGWGTAKITATDGGQTAWVAVTVGPRPPAVTGIALSSSQVNVDAGDAAQHFLVAVQADRGVAALGLTVEAVRRGVSAPQSHACSAPAAPASGTSRAGTWQCTILVPRGSAAGTWNLKSLSVTDSLGKTTAYHESSLIATGLAAAGLARSFEVESANEDLAPPVLTSVVLQPPAVKLGTSGQTVQITFTASDAGTGLFSGASGLSPGPGPGTMDCGSAPSAGVGAQTSAFTCSRFIPANSGAGTYLLEIELVDRARNRWRFSSAQLQAAGLPHEVVATQ
ncbi:MAG TPA: Ig-like domain-containing protein [Longimicrobium sp.]|jgi:hypothetical protein|uniref:Ig-like domain-containing protein n=1 Tax=Longimicrobium sp. TaxID=2029185 RepID=UPI002EDAD95B